MHPTCCKNQACRHREVLDSAEPEEDERNRRPQCRIFIYIFIYRILARCRRKLYAAALAGKALPGAVSAQPNRAT
jgi:hypothetical protein